jgi:hypothetical protein
MARGASKAAIRLIELLKMMAEASDRYSLPVAG